MTESSKVSESVEIGLTIDQEDALNSFREWLDSSASSIPFVLNGYAGSGKTYLSRKFLKLVEQKGMCWTVVAPTHKAVGVLRQALLEEKISPTWYPSTIHRLLRLKLKRKADIEVCEKTDQTEDSLNQLGLVLVDEASMIDSNLLEIVLECALIHKTRIVFVGDPAQLPPVGEKISPVFKMKRALFCYLNEVVRHQGAVLKLAQSIRNGDIPCEQPPLMPILKNKKAVVGFLDRESWLEKAKSALKAAANKEDYDAARIVCYTNKVVESLVPYARRAIHGEMADQYYVLPGEVLISRKAVMLQSSVEDKESGENPDMLIGTNREMVVIDVAPKTFDLLSFGLTQDQVSSVAEIETLVATVNCDQKEFTLRLLPPVGSRSRDLLENILKNLSSQAKEMGKKENASLWRQFFFLRDAFASLGPASVLTVHRSQGSTFGNVFIAPDVYWPKDEMLRKQLVYVAITRASKGVWIVGKKSSEIYNKFWKDSLGL